MGTESSRLKLASSALDLFEKHGYDHTTVDMIAEHAGLSRTTFFRLFQTKEDVALIDHESLLEQVHILFSNSTKDQAMATLTNAAFVTLKGYLDEGELSIRRYKLSRSVPSLYVRELSSMHRYELVFRKFIKRFIFPDASDTLQVELLAGAVTTASNHVLREWLRGSSQDPVHDFNEAIAVAISRVSLGGSATAEGSNRADYLIVRADSGEGQAIQNLTRESEWRRVIFEL